LSVHMPQVPVSIDGQSAFADGPVACEQTGLVTTAILDQCCLKYTVQSTQNLSHRVLRTSFLTGFRRSPE
ncbi:hypothetical protein, partial [Dyella sp.]|uniref:hypothetical protein n=1 Tax=Dyella sp. TaxID=1869338 RepID=UPI002D786F72